MPARSTERPQGAHAAHAGQPIGQSNPDPVPARAPTHARTTPPRSPSSPSSPKSAAGTPAIARPAAPSHAAPYVDELSDHTDHGTGALRPLKDGPLDFDDFYLATRRRLLLQCLALTGDLVAARSAVRDAYVAAAHHWRKVSRLDVPEDWVRPRAWRMAQRRSVARIWHKEKDLTPKQGAVLDAVSKLPDVQRRTLLLAHLASLPMAGIGRELAQTRTATEEHLQAATSSLALALDCDSTLIRGQLESLAPLVTSPGLPRVTAIRRSGQRRLRRHTAVGTVAAVAIALGAGWFVGTHQTGAAERARILARPVTASMLLAPDQVRGISPKQQWTVTATGDNTQGSGINTICQRSRFADDRGLGTWMRKLQASGSPSREVLQTVEVSESPGAAISTYRTTLGWFAGCTQARVRLAEGFMVRNVGDEARALELTVPAPTPRTYLVTVARSGALTTTTVLQTTSASTSQLQPLLVASSASLRNLCRSSAITACKAGTPAAVPALPPSGEATGMLATVDLPAVATITKPWVGTDPVRGGPNLAATTCDQADFTKLGSHPQSRTFLIPEQPGLPQVFGITETTGTFASAGAADKLVQLVRTRMKTCEKRQLGSRISHHVDQSKADARAGATYSLWRQTAEINAKKATVSYWMGIVRVGNRVAQVNFTPSGKDDVDEATFRALVVRARDRLAELGS